MDSHWAKSQSTPVSLWQFWVHFAAARGMLVKPKGKSEGPFIMEIYWCNRDFWLMLDSSEPWLGLSQFLFLTFNLLLIQTLLESFSCWNSLLVSIVQLPLFPFCFNWYFLPFCFTNPLRVSLLLFFLKLADFSLAFLLFGKTSQTVMGEIEWWSFILEV